MASPAPYVIDDYIVYADEIIKTGLSFAVRPIDEYTGKQPSGRIKIMIEEEKNISAIRNPSGYYLFTNLSAGDYTLNINAEFYFTEKITINTSSLDPKNPVVEVVLKPGASYPFPENATLIRGVVRNTVPVVNAGITVTGKAIKTLTDAKGEFVLFFRGIKKEDISIEIKKDVDTKVKNTTVEEGKTISVGVIQFP